ncbi:MAG: hypothetical protein V4721_08390 [Bacteroidota bacterium]
MGTDYNDPNAQGAKDQSNREENERSGNVNQNPGSAGQSKNPPDQQPSASQHNEWQEDHGDKSNGRQTPGQRETNVRPDQQFRASEDDELGEEQPEDYRRDEFVEENHLEATDQDFRDGENQSGEDQDDEDELRNGK